MRLMDSEAMSHRMADLWRRTSFALSLGVCLALGPLLASGQTKPSASGAASVTGLTVTQPNGYAVISMDDMHLMTTAGEVRWARVWDGQEWKFQPHWESLSQSWKNLTGSQSADTTAGTVSDGSAGSSSSAGGALSSSSSGGGAGSGCWVWVDEDWQPSIGTAIIGGIPEVGPMVPVRTTPFNRLMGETSLDYPQPQRVSVDFASLCAGSSVASGSSFRDTEGIRRINELYLGDSGRYAFSNRSVLEKRAVQQMPVDSAAAIYSQLSTGRLAIVPQTNERGFRWIDRGGDWIDYNTQGQMVAYGDRNNNVVRLVRDTAGVLRGVVDAGGRVLWSLHYTGELLSEIRDYPASGIAGDLPSRNVKYQYDDKNRLIKVTDVRGFVTQYDYDVGNHIIKITDPEGRVEKLAYSGDTVKQRIAPDGAVTDYLFDYDDANKQFISKVTGPETAAGRRVDDFTYNRVGQLVRQIVNGRTEVEVRYDTGARAELSTNARGFTTRTTRDEYDQTIEVMLPDGGIKRRTYSPVHLEVTEEIDVLGVKTLYEYDSRGNLIVKTEAAGTPDERVTSYTRNTLGQMTAMKRRGRTESSGTVTADAVWEFSYDALGQLSVITDPEGHVRRFEYNRFGNLLASVDPLGNTTRFEVDAAGNVLTETSPLGHRKAYAYDKVGNLTAETDAVGKTALKGYDAMNRPLRTTNRVGGVARVQYNGQGLPVLEVDEDGVQNQFSYDSFDRIESIVDALGHVVRFGYQLDDGSESGLLGSLGDPVQADYPGFQQINRLDALERPTSQTLRYSSRKGLQASTTSATYDLRGQVVAETDAQGQRRTHRYNSLGLKVETLDALGGSTRYAYDVAGNLLVVTNARGHTHSFSYDRNGRMVTEKLPMGQTIRYEYDAAGRLVKRTDRLGRIQTYTHDADGRVVRVEYAGADGTLVRVLTQSWDANSLLVGWSDKDILLNATTVGIMSYDDAARKRSESITFPSSTSLSYQVDYSPSGRKTRLIWPDGTEVQYGYSAHGELDSVLIPGEGLMSFGDFSWTSPTQVTLPGGGLQLRTLDGLLNLEGLTANTPSQQTTLKLDNEFGKAQELQIRRRTDTFNSTSSTAADQFRYDADLRLIQWTRSVGTESSTVDELYTLDAVANRVRQSTVAGPWVYDDNGRLTQIGQGACGQAGVTCYDYDEAGSLTKKTTSLRIDQFRYDHQNRLTEILTGTGEPVARYGYDPLDRRIWKEQFRDRQGTPLPQSQRTYYLYADEGLVAEAVQPIELNADGSTTALAAASLTAQYVPRPEQSFTTGTLLVKTKDSNDQDMVAYYHHDHLQVPIQASDKMGNVVWSATYTPFGRATVTTPMATRERPVITSQLRLPGQYEDAESGLHYNFRRYYDPDVGRYLTEDPIGLDGGVNLYGYANANPLLYMDPRGEVAPAVVWAARAAAAALAAALKRCAKDPVCRCRALYAAYKTPCAIPCTRTGSCAYLTFAAGAAEMCYRGRNWYIAAGCDKHIPTTKDHPAARDQAATTYSNCIRARDAACKACAL